VGRNYAAHIAELGNETPQDMVIFNKPNSAITRTLHANLDEPLHYESEIAFLVINQTLAGVGFGLDLTKRVLQSSLKAKGLPWERAKAFNGAALFSEFVSCPEDRLGLEVRLHVNGELRQHGGVEMMLYKPLFVLSQLRQFMRLEDGDIIMTGTPAGVGEVRAGDQFEGAILNRGQILVEQSWQAI
jgi:2-keto-4-pentenoate hydratase/2-oxohepta-3-ene-1,7-dioic acid hydratase in catechol pathway